MGDLQHVGGKENVFALDTEVLQGEQESHDLVEVLDEVVVAAGNAGGDHFLYRLRDLDTGCVVAVREIVEDLVPGSGKARRDHGPDMRVHEFLDTIGSSEPDRGSDLFSEGGFDLVPAMLAGDADVDFTGGAATVIRALGHDGDHVRCVGLTDQVVEVLTILFRAIGEVVDIDGRSRSVAVELVVIFESQVGRQRDLLSRVVARTMTYNRF